jgi:hypothetical protein
VVSSVRRTETYFAGAEVSVRDSGSRLIFVVIVESLVVIAIVVFVGVITSFVV